MDLERFNKRHGGQYEEEGISGRGTSITVDTETCGMFGDKTVDML